MIIKVLKRWDWPLHVCQGDILKVDLYGKQIDTFPVNTAFSCVGVAYVEGPNGLGALLLDEETFSRVQLGQSIL